MIDNDNFLFSFAVVTDSHIKLEEGDESSPFQANQLANSRNKYLVKKLNAISPDFVIHLGDFVQPVPSLPTYEPAMEIAKAIFDNLNCPLHQVPGNHDIGDKPLDWMPGPKVDQHGVQLYEKYWGRSYNSFDHKGIHFVLINNPILNSGLDCEKEQKEWLEQDLAENQGKRIFVCTHYPLYLNDPKEGDHYDNISEPARSWLLSLFKKYNVEATYAGHVHHFFYNKFENTEEYVLPSVTFIRHDYSEMFHVEPEASTEGGRNDVEKMGFYLVKVYENKHVNHLVKTKGKMAEEFDSTENRIETFHMKENDNNPYGVYLRHAWGERSVLPYANLDEFDRKIVNNDYLLMDLWDLGIKKLRIPVCDLLDDRIRKRINTLKEAGHEFTIFTTGIPNEDIKKDLIQYQDLIDTWELILTEKEISEIISHASEVKNQASMKVHISKIETSAGSKKKKGSRFHHFIHHGFSSTDDQWIKEFFNNNNTIEAIDGLVFRLGPFDSIDEEIKKVRRIINEHQISSSIHIQMQGSDNLAYAHEDNEAIANRLAEAMISTYSLNDSDFFFDTFMDHDRGYYRRNGIVDRRMNPRLSYHVIKNLYSCLKGFQQSFESKAIDINLNSKNFALKSSDNHDLGLLVLPENNNSYKIKDIALSFTPKDNSMQGAFINLKTGTFQRFDWEIKDGNIQVEQEFTFSDPIFITFNSLTVLNDEEKSVSVK